MRGCSLESALQGFARECGCLPAHYHDEGHAYPMCTKKQHRKCHFTNEGFIFDNGIKKPCLDTCEGVEMAYYHSSNLYPDRGSFHREREFPIVVRKVKRSCGNEKRKVMEKKYPGLCSLVESTDVHDGWDYTVGLTEDQFEALREKIVAYGRDNLIKIDLFVKTPTAKMYERQEEITFLEFLGYVGGFLAPHLY